MTLNECNLYMLAIGLATVVLLVDVCNCV